MLWVTLIAAVWITLVVLVVAICRSAAAADDAQPDSEARRGRFQHGAAQLPAQRRTPAR